MPEGIRTTAVQLDFIYCPKIIKTLHLFLFILFIRAEKTARLVRPRFFPNACSLKVVSKDNLMIDREGAAVSWSRTDVVLIFFYDWNQLFGHNSETLIHLDKIWREDVTWQDTSDR